ncbi:hypothetical protein BDV93DRAFT_547991 [Ceratobasidium sp. AG-I]|nr:hypothetical protein BDV93DRAFT_547991 [Ceratobasidium sp. AG-I]
MHNFTGNSSRGIPLDDYIEQKKTSRIKKYSAAEVKSAIQLLVPNHLRTASDSTLEAALSVIYHPKLMPLLVNEMTAVACSFHILENHGNPLLFRRSYGFLLVQILGLATELGLLAQNQQLIPFIESVPISSRLDGTEVLSLLKSWSMRFIHRGIENRGGRLLGFKDLVGWKSPPETPDPICLKNVGGHSFHSAMNMIAAAYSGRDGILKAQIHIPALGYPVLLSVMWAHLSFPSHNSFPPNLWAMHCDIVVRYFLAASPLEYSLMETLLDEIVREGKLSFSGPMDVADAEVIVTAVLRQLSLRHDRGTPIKLRYTELLTEFAIRAAEGSKQFHLHIPIFTTAFNRLWYEIVRTSQHPQGESWETILSYATLLLDGSVAFIGGTGTRQHMEANTWPQLLLMFDQIDIVNLTARLLLAPPVAAKSRKNPELTISEKIINSLNLLANRLRSFPELVTSMFQSRNFDWHKTVSYLLQIETMSLPPTHPLQLHLESRRSAWFLFGNALGCMERPEAQPCTYPRCAGAETSVLGYLICGECLTLTYCSTRCQQADWLHKESLHRFVCPPDSVTWDKPSGLLELPQ